MFFSSLTKDREIQSAASGLKDPNAIKLAHELVEAAYNVFESHGESAPDLRKIATIFTTGSSGLWEKCGNWLIKLASFPSVTETWRQLASDPKWKIRWRAAAFLDDLPRNLYEELFPQFLNDQSVKVRSFSAQKPYRKRDDWTLNLLRSRLLVENDATVLESLRFSIEYEDPPIAIGDTWRPAPIYKTFTKVLVQHESKGSLRGMIRDVVWNFRKSRWDYLVDSEDSAVHHGRYPETSLRPL